MAAGLACAQCPWQLWQLDSRSSLGMDSDLVQPHWALNTEWWGDMAGLTENMTMKQDIHKLVT